MTPSQEINEVLSQGLLKQLQNAAPGDWHTWGPAALVALGLVILFALALFLRTRIRYKIGSIHLHVLVWGLPVRSLRLDNIRHAHRHHRRFAERWDNTLFPQRNRLLVLEKRRGLFKHFVISPDKRQVFKVKLEQAIARSTGANCAHAAGPASSEAAPAPAENPLPQNAVTGNSATG